MHLVLPMPHCVCVMFSCSIRACICCKPLLFVSLSRKIHLNFHESVCVRSSLPIQEKNSTELNYAKSKPKSGALLMCLYEYRLIQLIVFSWFFRSKIRFALKLPCTPYFRVYLTTIGCWSDFLDFVDLEMFWKQVCGSTRVDCDLPRYSFV